MSRSMQLPESVLDLGLSITQVAEVFGISRSSADNMLLAGIFNEQVTQGRNRLAPLRSVLEILTAPKVEAHPRCVVRKLRSNGPKDRGDEMRWSESSSEADKIDIISTGYHMRVDAVLSAECIVGTINGWVAGVWSIDGIAQEGDRLHESRYRVSRVSSDSPMYRELHHRVWHEQLVGPHKMFAPMNWESIEPTS